VFNCIWILLLNEVKEMCVNNLKGVKIRTVSLCSLIEQ